MDLTDEEIMLLEQLTYLNDDIYDAAGKPEHKNDYKKEPMTVEQFLSGFDEEAINTLRNMGDEEIKSDRKNPETGEYEGTHTSGKEWADIIEAAKKNQNINKLEVSNITTVPAPDGSGYNLDAMTFTKSGNQTDAVVCFRGTLNGKEWGDNGEYFAGAATDCNQVALLYINGLPYTNITVAGHSKGANKAAYVYYTSDKVKNCVAMDMPCFPPEFYLQYGEIIANKKDGIRVYALESDFVNILVLPIPGIETIYCKGHGVAGFAENHCPDCFFFYDENGRPYVVVGEQTQSMKILHDFTAFAALEMPYDKRIQVGAYIGNILQFALGHEGDADSIIDVIMSDTETLSYVASYFLKYCELYDVNMLELLKVGLDISCNNSIPKEILAVLLVISLFAGATAAFPIIKSIVEALLVALLAAVETFKINTNTPELAALEKRDNLGYQGYSNKKYNYTQEAYSTIKSNISAFNGIEYESPANTWNNYAGIEWYDEINADGIKNALTTFIGLVPDLNDNCATEFTNSFNNEWQVDNYYYNAFCSHMRNVDTTIQHFAKLKDRMVANVSLGI